MLDDTSTAALVKGIIDIALALDLDVVAEGVEEVAQQTLLYRLGCPSLQGYFFAKPLPVDAFRSFMTRMSIISRVAPRGLRSA